MRGVKGRRKEKNKELGNRKASGEKEGYFKLQSFTNRSSIYKKKFNVFATVFLTFLL